MGISWSGCCEHQPTVQGACQTAAPPISRELERGHLLAPPWHTQALVALMLAVAAAGTAIGASTTTATGQASWSDYAPLTIVNAALSIYVCRVGLPSNRFSAWFSHGRYDARRLLTDSALALALALLLISAENGLQARLGMPESTAAHALLPITASAKVAWFCTAALVGFSEELVYRGYLQRQLGAVSRQPLFGIVAQALLFGIAHGEQGPWAVARFAVYAVALGGLAAARKSLLPGIMCHVAIDWYAAASV